MLVVMHGCAVVAYTAYRFPSPSIETVQHASEFVKMMSQDAQHLVSMGTQKDARTKSEKWLAEAIKICTGSNCFQPLVMPNYHVFNLPDAMTEEQRALVAREYRRVLETVVSERRIEAVQMGVLFWLLPAILLALFGLAVIWIVEGFTRATSRTP